MCDVTLSGFAGVFPLLAPMLGDVVDLAVARKHFEDGKQSFNSGDYQVALDKFQDAYDLCGKQELLYNIGLAYRKLKGDRDIQYLQAIAFFKRYLETNPSEPLRKRAEANIAKIKGEKVSDSWTDNPYDDLDSKLIDVFGAEVVSEKPHKAPPLSGDRSGTDGDDEHVTREGGGIDLEARIEARTDRPNYGIYKWASAALALASFATGGVSYFLAKKKGDEHAGVVEQAVSEGKITGKNGNRRFVDADAKGEYRGRLDELDEAADRRGTVATVGLISGAVLSATAGVFFWLDRDQPHNAGHARLTVGPLEGGGSVSLGIQF